MNTICILLIGSGMGSSALQAVNTCSKEVIVQIGREDDELKYLAEEAQFDLLNLYDPQYIDDTYLLRYPYWYSKQQQHLQKTAVWAQSYRRILDNLSVTSPHPGQNL